MAFFDYLKPSLGNRRYGFLKRDLPGFEIGEKRGHLDKK
jgi:hypothetical protein